MMTRKALSRQEESNLQLALQELKAAKDLCDQLTFEREENEKILVDALDRNSKLKSELSSLHIQHTCVIEERDRLQYIIEGFDQCGAEYEQALKRTSILEKELCDAHQQITSLEESAQCSATLKTQNLFDELLSADRESGHISGSCCATPTVTIDLTNDDSVGVHAACTKNSLSKTKLKKYVKINKYIIKTKRKLKNLKCVAHKIRNMREKIEIRDKLQVCTLQLENRKIKYESDIEQLQSELDSVMASLRSITTRYEKSQEAMREYSLALDQLLQLSHGNQERFDSLIANHNCDCQRTESPGLVSSAVPTSKPCLTTKNNNKNTVMFCDEIGKDMGHLLNTRMGHSVINNCLPDASLHEVMQSIARYNFNPESNLIIWVGNRGNVNKSDLMKYMDTLCSLQLNKIVMFTFPYSNSMSQAENDLRHKLNLTLHTISCNNKCIHVIDSNNIVSKNYYLTKGRYYLSNFNKRQVAVSLSYYFSITAKNLATQSASIEHCINNQNQAMAISPSHLN